MFKNIYIVIFVLQSFFGQILCAAENGIHLLRDLDTMDRRLRHGDNEIWGVKSGPKTRAFSYQEWISLKENILAFKGEVEKILGDPTNDLDLQENAWNTYAGLYAKAMNLYAIIAPNNLENLNHELGLKILDKDQKIPLEAISANNLVLSEKYYRLIETLSGKSILVYTDQQVKNFAEVNEPDYLAQTTPTSEKRMEQMLFKASQKIMLDRLNQGREMTESLLGAVDQQKQELEFRRAVFNKLYLDPGTKALLSPYFIDLEWIRAFLGLLYPETEFTEESEFNLQLQMLGLLQHSHWAVIQKKWTLFYPYPSITLSSMEIQESFCDLIEETRLQGWEEGIFKVAETIQYREEIREFLKQTLEKIPSFSCASIQILNDESVEKMKQDVREQGSRDFDALLASLTHLKKLDTNNDAFLEEEVDFKSGLFYFYLWLKQEAKREQGGFFSRKRWENIFSSQEPEEPLENIIDDWHYRHSSFLKLENYESFRKEFFRYRDSLQEVDSWPNLSGAFKEKMIKEAKTKQRVLDKMNTFFRFDENRETLKMGEIPHIEEDLEIFKDYWLQEQKTKFPILSTVLSSKDTVTEYNLYSYALEEDKTLWDLLTLHPEKNRPLLIKALEKSVQNNREMVETIQNFTDISQMNSALKNSETLENALGSDPRLSSYYLETLEKLRKQSPTETTLLSLGQKYYHTGFLGLIGIHIVGVLLVGLKWPRVASYFLEAYQAISPRGHLLFFASAMGIIGAEMSHMGHSIYGDQEAEYQQARNLHHSFSLGDTEHTLIDFEEYSALMEDLEESKGMFATILVMDTLLLGLPAIFFIPQVRKGLMDLVTKGLTARNNRFAAKANKAFSDLGMERITWDKDIIDGVYALRKKEVDSRIYQQGKLIEQKIRISGTSDSELSRLIKQYKDTYTGDRTSLDKSYQFLMRKKTRMERAWERYAKQQRFDLERLGLPPQRESFTQLGDAFNNAKNRLNAGEITVQEFQKIQESFDRTYNFLLRKFYFASQVESTKSLFLHSVVDMTRLSSYRKQHLPPFQLNDHEYFEYKIIELKMEGGEGSASLIVPNIVDMRTVPLLEKTGGTP